ncbi:MAG: hypothetical protein ACBR12_14410 [Microcoleus sp.]
MPPSRQPRNTGNVNLNLTYERTLGSLGGIRAEGSAEVGLEGVLNLKGNRLSGGVDFAERTASLNTGIGVGKKLSGSLEGSVKLRENGSIESIGGGIGGSIFGFGGGLSADNKGNAAISAEAFGGKVEVARDSSGAVTVQVCYGVGIAEFCTTFSRDNGDPQNSGSLRLGVGVKPSAGSTRPRRPNAPTDSPKRPESRARKERPKPERPKPERQPKPPEDKQPNLVRDSKKKPQVDIRKKPSIDLTKPKADIRKKPVKPPRPPKPKTSSPRPINLKKPVPTPVPKPIPIPRPKTTPKPPKTPRPAPSPLPAPPPKIPRPAPVRPGRGKTQAECYPPGTYVLINFKKYYWLEEVHVGDNPIYGAEKTITYKFVSGQSLIASEVVRTFDYGKNIDTTAPPVTYGVDNASSIVSIDEFNKLPGIGSPSLVNWDGPGDDYWSVITSGYEYQIVGIWPNKPIPSGCENLGSPPKPQPPRLPNQPTKIKPMDCCKKVDEIYKYLGIGKLKKEKFKVAKAFLVPGGTGTEDCEDYYQLNQALFRMLANGLIINPVSKPLGSEWKSVNATAWAGQVYEMVAEAMSNGDSSQKYEISMMMQITQLLSIIAEQTRKIEFLSEVLGVEPGLDTEEIPACFTIYEGHKGFDKTQPKRIDTAKAKTDDEVEAILSKMLKPSKIPITKWVFKPESKSIVRLLRDE